MKSLKSFFKKFAQKLAHDSMPAYASDTTLYIIISFFPFLMFLLTLLQFLPFSQAELVGVIDNFLPSQVAEIVDRLIAELYSTSTAVLSLTIFLTLWTASRGILGIYRGLNSIYDCIETRGYIHLRLRSMFYTIIFSIILILLLGLYVFGNQIQSWLLERFPTIMMNKYAILIVSFRSTIGVVILFALFITMYCFVPNRRGKFLASVPGAIVASVGWVLFSYLYSLYIDNMSNMKATYGSLTAIVLCVTWLYFCMYLFFLGAEINSVIDTPDFKNSVRRLFGKKPVTSE